MRVPTDDELDMMARQARASLERLVDTKDKEQDRKGSVGRQIPRFRPSGVETEQRGRVSLPTDDSWKLDGVCWRLPGRWMDVANGPNQAAAMERELAMCAVCPVIDVCLEYGLKEPAGIWGGKLPKERRRIVRERKKVTT